MRAEVLLGGAGMEIGLKEYIEIHFINRSGKKVQKVELNI